MLHHIEIYVSNLENTRAFYEKFLPLLGYELYQEWEEGVSYIKDKCYLVFVQTREKYLANPYNRCNVGLNHLAFACQNKEEILKIRNILLQNNVSLLYDDAFPYAGGENYFALYFEDPDRIKLELALWEN